MDKNCLICGKQFVYSKTNKKYCCKECYKQACDNKRANIYAKLKGTKKGTCLTCKREFFRSQHYLKYCSDECREIAIEKKQQPKPPVFKPCIICGKDFKVVNRKQQCCIDCREIYEKQKKRNWYFDKKKRD